MKNYSQKRARRGRVAYRTPALFRLRAHQKIQNFKAKLNKKYQ